MDIPSYLPKTFFVTDPVAIVRDENLAPLLWKAGTALPAGAKIGDVKRVPQHAEIRVSAHKAGEERSLYVFEEPVDSNPLVPSGWTRATNLEGHLLNELLGYQPTEWDQVPDGKAYTVTDSKALIRSGAPAFKSQGDSIPFGSYVSVVERSDTKPAGKFVRVHAATMEGGVAVKGAEIGWTAASNLTDGLSALFKGDEWKNQRGPNAAWRTGTFLGAQVLVDIVGTGAQIERIALWTLKPYLAMVKAAAKQHHEIVLTSGFRTFGQQKDLYDAYKAGRGNLAAKPGRSNHQHGQAFDLNTRGLDTPIYKWLAINGPKHGFVRTVKSEHWHWEYRPEDATRLAKAGHHGIWN